MFYGTFPITLDVKGRLSVPVKLRDFFASESDNVLWITAGIKENLLIYTVDGWHRVVAQLNKLPLFDEMAQSLKYRYIGMAADCAIDASGRVLIPPVLREHAQLEKKVMLVGTGDKFELWRKEYWDAKYICDTEKLRNLDSSTVSEALRLLIL